MECRQAMSGETGGRIRRIKRMTLKRDGTPVMSKQNLAGARRGMRRLEIAFGKCTLSDIGVCG
jgi:hypothetical protein